MHVYSEDVGGRVLLGDNTGSSAGHAATDQVSVCSSLDLNWTPFFSAYVIDDIYACAEFDFNLIVRNLTAN